MKSTNSFRDHAEQEKHDLAVTERQSIYATVCHWAIPLPQFLSFVFDFRCFICNVYICKIKLRNKFIKSLNFII